MKTNRHITAFVLSCILALFLVGCAATSQETGDLIWPPPPETPRIKWIAEWKSKNDFNPSNSVLDYFMGAEALQRFRRPQGVTTDAMGNIFATDTELGLVFVFDIEKKDFRVLGEGILEKPVGVAIDNNRNIVYVADTGLSSLVGLNKTTGKAVMRLGSQGLFKNPSGVAFDDTRDRLYLSDTKNHMIRVFDGKGVPLYTIGRKGQDTGEFLYPTYLSLDTKGNLCVVDAFNFRIQIFDPNGNFLKKFGRLGDGFGTFSRPAGIGVDSENHFYVIDTAFQNFQIFRDDGVLLLNVGRGGTKAGHFNAPTGLYIDKRDDRIYVADTFNRRIQVFQYLKEKQK